MAAATIVKSIATEVAPSPFASFRTGEEVLDPSLCIHDVALAAYDIKDTRLVVDVESCARFALNPLNRGATAADHQARVLADLDRLLDLPAAATAIAVAIAAAARWAGSIASVA